MNIISALKKFAVLSSVSLIIASHTQAATFADSSNTSALNSPDMTVSYLSNMPAESFDASISKMAVSAVNDSEFFDQTPGADSFNLEASASSGSFSMLLAGLSMMTFVVMRRRIKL